MSKKITKEKKTTLLAKEFQEFIDSHEVNVDIKINFPEYRILPADLKLALLVLSKHTSQYVLNFVKKETKE